MAYDPRCFLNLATNLIIDNNYNGEARFRTSISRAYYAAHLFSRKKLELIGCTISKKNTAHKEVIEHMKKKNPLVGDMLFKLKRKRQNADYDLTSQFTEYQTQTIILEAETIIEEANKIK